MMEPGKHYRLTMQFMNRNSGWMLMEGAIVYCMMRDQFRKTYCWVSTPAGGIAVRFRDKSKGYELVEPAK